MDIEINGVSITLTDEQVQEVAKHLAKKEEPKMFPQKGDKYWFYWPNGSIDSSLTIDSKGRINSFKTKEEAETAIDIAFAKMRLKHHIAVANNGWTPDWNSNRSPKYHIVITNGLLEIDYFYSIKTQPNYMYIKSKKLAKQLLKEHKADFELVLGE